MNAQRRAARRMFSLIERLSESACASCAAAAFRLPPRSRLRPGERRILSRATMSFTRGNLGRIAVWRWGEGPRVLLVHGWGGHAGRLSRFVPALLRAGFGVAALDAPAHGLSAGWLASLPDFVEAIGRVAGDVAPVALIGHSMGAAACALALRHGLPVSGAVLLAPFVDPEPYTVRFARALGLSKRATSGMQEALQRRYRTRFCEWTLLSGAPDVRTLVVHDRGDGRVPIREGRAISRAWPQARLVSTRGLGHHKILRSEQVIRRAVRFLRAGIGAAAAAPVLAAG